MTAIELRDKFKSLVGKVEHYFLKAEEALPEEERIEHAYKYSHVRSDYYWEKIDDALRDTARELIGEILPLCAQLAELTKASPLTGPEDTQDVKLSTKGIRAALLLRRFSYSSIEVLHDEGMVLGVKPPEQNEDIGLYPKQASAEFDDHLSKIAAVLKLVQAAPQVDPESINIVPRGQKYRAGTAFIMMWMDPKNPDLSDVVDAVKEIFQRFGVRALRADDIEHEGQITERILNEIKTSEFLFADLTGTRPNVYYETGYAHALGKRVIMFRKSGTSIHFDLAGYNCPEYENLRDLKEKLTKRLISITNKNPSDVEKI